MTLSVRHFSFAFLLFILAPLAGCSAQGVSPQRTEAESLAVASPTPASPTALTIAAVGDIMLGSPFPDDTRMPPNDGADLLKPLTELLSSADITFGNMEGPIVDSGVSEKCGTPKPGQPVRCFAFRMPTRYAKYLKNAGFDVMSLANNHAGDFGDAGRSSTRRTLDSLGIKHAGSDRTQYSTTFLEVRGRKVAFVGFAHNNIVPNVNDLAAAKSLVTQASRNADIVVVSFHGGAEGTDHQRVPQALEVYAGEKRGNLPLFARTVIDAGADLVLGHGPHVLRGMEVYKDRLIAYSLGNFATYGWFRLEAETALTVILEADLALDGKFLGGRIHAGKQEGRGEPVLDTTGAAIRKIKSLSEMDFPSSKLKIGVDGSLSPE